MRSPTARTLKLLRDAGAECRVVEQWVGFGRKTDNGASGIRRDLWGADILARQGQLLMAIQSTSGSNHSARINKSLGNPEIRNWLDCGVNFYVYSWSKRGPRGKRKVWTPKIAQIITDGEGVVKVL